MAIEEFNGLQSSITTLQAKINALSSKVIDPLTTEGQKQIANMDKWSKEVKALTIKVVAAGNKVQGFTDALNTANDALVKANDFA